MSDDNQFLDNSGKFIPKSVDNFILDSGFRMAMTPAGLEFLNRHLAMVEPGRVGEWLYELLDNISTDYVAGEEVEYERLTMTPWDLNDALGWEDDDDAPRTLPVNFIASGQLYHLDVNMDHAMGMYLLSKVSGQDLHMTMYGIPLTYFNKGEDDTYLRYNDEVSEDENYIQMVGSDRKYFFYGDDFLQGIVMAANYLGIDHHDFWTQCRDIDGEPINF